LHRHVKQKNLVLK